MARDPENQSLARVSLCGDRSVCRPLCWVTERDRRAPGQRSYDVIIDSLTMRRDKQFA